MILLSQFLNRFFIAPETNWSITGYGQWIENSHPEGMVNTKNEKIIGGEGGRDV